MKIERFEDIQSWQEARVLVNRVYDISLQGSFAHDAGLRDQIRRAAVSVMSNVAEGFSSQGNKSFVRYLYIAFASLAEVQSQLYIALDRKYLSKEEFEECYEQCTTTAKLVSGFIKYLSQERKVKKPPLPRPTFKNNGTT